MDAVYFDDTSQPYHCKRYEPDFQTDHTIDFMGAARTSGDDPFFAYVCFGPPHFPMNMPKHWKEWRKPETTGISKWTSHRPIYLTLKEADRYLKDVLKPKAIIVP